MIQPFLLYYVIIFEIVANKHFSPLFPQKKLTSEVFIKRNGQLQSHI